MGAGLWVRSPNITIDGVISMNGEEAQQPGCGQGGGRIKLFYETFTNNGTLSATGGSVGPNSDIPGQPGANGTTYEEILTFAP